MSTNATIPASYPENLNETFSQFVYEPLIAPKLEAWAESYVEGRRQRRRQRQGPVLSQPVNEHGDENTTRRSAEDRQRADDASIELEQLAARERDEWRNAVGSSTLRRRTTAGALEESHTIAYPIMTPTHVIADTSSPPSPGGQSIRTSAPSADNSPTRPHISLFEPQPSTRSHRLMSPRLPTPVSNYSLSSSRAMTPTSTLSEHSPVSSRQLSPDLGASLALPSSYNTPLDRSTISEADPAPAYTDPLLNPGSPFSDIHSVEARHSPEYTSPSYSPGALIGSPRMGSPSISSDFTVDSDDGFDVLSPRSGMFSPSTRNSRLDDDPFEVGSQHESEVSWTSVGRRSPPPQF
ncbi:hypothetical protein DICSQDRAFT_169240 [Dichomitus squalens LYAD-421 SS1]|uniref:Uncharacterized protein n=1 Tax=Dichomitus squalens (strain LYAD-421) TaxID=732165 RepID=R7T1C2_DICSQ|nr:uncharacterized protein DICSQDRAFT_169240 [Dichomitus squalens LYAD-421 SS1]EJF62209.1 hypothetical protein DICSQDRAFT_169240 [Dichomitus squalens LYAD-421 SS1]